MTTKAFPRPRLSSRMFLAMLSMGFIAACQTGTGTADIEFPGGGTEQNGSPSVSFPIRHYHYPEANENVVLKDDLPDTVLIRLNGIPGRFGGNPTADHLFDTAMARGASFPVPWARLLLAPGTQPIPYIRERNSMDSVTPAGVNIMRIGTFADGGTDSDIFPDSVFEGYSFYDTKRKIGTLPMYFSGPATVHADYPLCDSTRIRMHLQIPSAGFYFLYQVRTGDAIAFALLPDLKDLVFSVRTSSDANFTYAMEAYDRQWGCLMAGAEAKSGAGKPGMPGPLSFRDWMALSR